jgi:branched-chain amino acid transport system substrate-binding protein
LSLSLTQRDGKNRIAACEKRKNVVALNKGRVGSHFFVGWGFIHHREEEEAIFKARHFLGILGTCLLVLCFLVPTGLAEQRRISVGVPLPLTGAKAKFGEMHHQSYLMALEEINNSGGIRKGKHKGYQLEFLFDDTFGKADTGRKVIERLISQNRVPLIMGAYSSPVAAAIAKVCEQRKIPFLSPSAAADKITQKRWKYTFRINPPASESVSGLQAFLLGVVRPGSMAILFEKTRFGTSIGKAMKRWCQENNVDSVMFEPYEPWAADFKDLLTMVYALNPDVIFTTARLADAILLVNQLAELNIQPRLLAGSAGTFSMPAFVRRVGTLSENMVSAALWVPNVKYAGAEKFASKHKGKYGTKPDYHGAQAYAAAYVCRDIFERSESLEARHLLEALRGTNMMTVFGPVKFVSYEKYRNQNKLSTLVVQIQNGKPVTIWPPEAATAGFVNPAGAW